MSVIHRVFLRAEKLPTADQLNAALANANIDLQLDPEWNTRADDGFWPATFQGYDAGFEWSAEALRDVEQEQEHIAKHRERLATCDLVVSLVTRSDFNQLASAIAAWGVLASTYGGIAYSDETDEFYSAKEVLREAKEQVAQPPSPPKPQISYPRESDEQLIATESRRTPHSLVLSASQRSYQLFLNTKNVPSSANIMITRRLEHREGELSVLEIEVNQRRIRFDSNGRVLEPEYVPDYSALVSKLGDTESIGLALRKGGAPSAVALSHFVRDESMDVSRRRLGVITLGLIGSEARQALDALRSLEKHAVLASDATKAIERILGN